MAPSLSRALLSILLPAVALGKGRRLGATPSLDTTAVTAEIPTAFNMVSRVFIPYDANANSLAYGMGAAEQVAYDHVNKYAYAVSEQGVVNVIDWNDAAAPAVMSAYAVDLNGMKLTDIEVCADKGVFFVAAGADDTVSNGKVFAYTAVQRTSPSAPTQLHEETVGPLPDMILPNADCTKLAVANEGEGDYTTSLVDPVGSVHILSSPDFSAASPTVTSEHVLLGAFTDAQLKAKGVHLPLELNAMEYWDDHSHLAGDLDFASARASYSPNMNLEPEYLAWSGDETKLFVNLQENSAVAVIDVPASGSPSFSDIFGLGAKDFGLVDIDIVEDGGCSHFHTYAGLKGMRNADSIAAMHIDGMDYMLTANEGDDKEYGDFEEKMKLKDIFDDDGTMDGDILGMTLSAAANATAMLAHGEGSGSLRITVGSAAVDYSNPAAPVMNSITVFGGRGISIYKYDSGTSPAMSLTWDSGSAFESSVCSTYPWAHNGIQDEEFGPVGGVLYNSASSSLKETIDEMNDPDQDGCSDGGDGSPGACPLGGTIDERSQKDGAAPEAIVTGVACGSMLAVTATEKSSVAIVYDVTDPTAPTQLFVKHLSPASQSKNPGIAYADGTLGEIDPESIIFLDAAHSPTGNAGVMFAGAWSGTMSFWEFTCPAGSSGDSNGSTDSTETTSSAFRAAAVISQLFIILFALLCC